MCDYTITVDAPEGFAKSLQPNNLQCYAEMEDGQMIPVRVVPSNCDLNEPAAIVNIKVKWSTRALMKNRSVINRLKRLV